MYMLNMIYVHARQEFIPVKLAASSLQPRLRNNPVITNPVPLDKPAESLDDACPLDTGSKKVVTY